MVEIEVRYEGRFEISKRVINKVTKVLIEKDLPTYITRGNVMFEITKKKRWGSRWHEPNTKVQQKVTHVLKNVTIFRDGKRYHYVPDGQTQYSGMRMRLEEW